MQSINDLFGTTYSLTKKGTPASERASIIDQLHSKLATPYYSWKKEPLTKKRVALRVGHIKTKDLYALLSNMKDLDNRGGNASSYFWFSTKVSTD